MRLAFSVLVFLLFNFCYADLPIHCLRHQVAGDWKLQISEPKLLTRPEDMNCGHETPDNPATSYLALMNTFQPKTEFLVTLHINTSVLLNTIDPEGSWTMIYDEGMDIRMNNQTFTSFFEYYPDEQGNAMSYCGRTVVGWYYDIQTGFRACFRGEKIVDNETEKSNLYGNPAVQMKVVQPNSSISLLQMASNSRFHKALRASNKVSLQKDFSDHTSAAAEFNNVLSKLWTANTYPDFEGKTVADLNVMAGRKKIGGVGQRPSLVNSFVQKSDVSDLPKQFSWREYIKLPREQKRCGSCYIFATVQMLEVRLKIKYDKDVELSPQHILDCSFYNQGCHGGYPFLVEKFANEFELVPESCSPYQASQAGCKTCNVSALKEFYRVENYKFIGGAYGKTNERDMMLEIQKNGPIVASFEPAYDFMLYKGGVYHSVEPQWVQKGQNQPEWERVDHSVLMYGWGETEAGEKYWELLNSWGENWGESGHFRMVRGVDESAIESLGEAADPIVIDNTKIMN